MNSAGTIAICDYGMGNLRSVEKALERVRARVVLSADHDLIGSAAGVIVPGVGAFPEAMRRIRALGLDGLIAERAEAGVPILGICLGMQLLFESSKEHEGSAGLGLLGGSVEPLTAVGLKVPHIGWAPLRFEAGHAEATGGALLEGIVEATPFYFVHSYVAHPSEPGELVASAAYGSRFSAIVGRGNVLGAQFHPEKSSAAGLRLLANFASICAAAKLGPALAR